MVYLTHTDPFVLCPVAVIFKRPRAFLAMKSDVLCVFRDDALAFLLMSRPAVVILKRPRAFFARKPGVLMLFRGGSYTSLLMSRPVSVIFKRPRAFFARIGLFLRRVLEREKK